MTTAAAVLSKLKKRQKGVTANDFPVGTRLAARIYDLRCLGFEIITVPKQDGRLARYVLFER